MKVVQSLSIIDSWERLKQPLVTLNRIEAGIGNGRLGVPEQSAVAV